MATIAQAQDITDRKRAEEALRESEEKFSKIGNSALDAVIMINDKGNIEFWNPAAEKIFGYTKEEVIDKNLHSFLTPAEHLPAHYKGWELFKETGHGNAIGKVVELSGKRKNGDIFPAEIALSVVEINNSHWALGYVRDITERKLSEEEIKRQNSELLLLNAEKDKFFSIISHDLRSPFTSFLGLTQIMAEELSSLTMPEIQNISNMMRTSATNLFRLLENLLEWSRIKQGLIPFTPELVQLYPIAYESIGMILEPAKIKGIEINVDIPNDIEVYADNNILQTIIRNLVSNAVKFTDKGGNITLSAKKSDGHSVEVSVKDTGIGMDSKILGNLFNIDIKTNRKGTEGEPSTGLGLILCKDFVEKHGGKLWAVSEEGKGSTFYFTIPLKNDVQ
jgi:PAS domain S-box-containing protein